MREAAEPAPLLTAHFDRDRLELDAVRRTIRAQIEADLDRIDRCLVILDSLDGDPDLEDGADAEPALGSIGGTAASRGCNQLLWSRGCTDDREEGDDNGIGDTGGLAEQRGRHLRLIEGGAA